MLNQNCLEKTGLALQNADHPRYPESLRPPLEQGAKETNGGARLKLWEVVT